MSGEGTLNFAAEEKRAMRQSQMLSVIAILLTFLVIATPTIASSGASSSFTSGYVSYQVMVSAQGTPNPVSFVVNESSSPTNQNGFDKIALGLSSSMQNLTYSKVVNTSSLPEVLPFIPGIITNQSISYSTHGVSLSARISNVGTAPISFNGTSYAGQKYSLSLSLTNSSSGQMLTASGTALAFPSGLLYSVQVQNSNDTDSVNVLLLSTNLPLKDPTSSASTAEGAAMVGAGILAAAAIAIPWRFRRKKNVAASSGSNSESKPSYWVD
jgi:hypothetical protein